MRHRKPATVCGVLKSEEPAVGALIYCQLATAEHSGIYLGGGRIAQLNGKGDIEVVSPKVFTDNITTFDTDIFVPVDFGKNPIACRIAARNAESVVGKKRNYNLFLDNCHQFASGCIGGDFENADNFLWMTKETFKNNCDWQTDVYWQRWKWDKR